MSSQRHNSRAIDTPLPPEKILLKALYSIMYYTPIANGHKILAATFHHIIKHQQKYADILNKTEFVFPQHSGAVMVNACFLLALERTAAMTDSYLTKLLEPVSRLFIISKGRPNIDVRVLFEQGNTTPAYGFHGKEEDDEGREDDNKNNNINIINKNNNHINNNNSLYARIMKLGPPIQAHHVLMHDPNKTTYRFNNMLIRAKAFPLYNRPPPLPFEQDEENNTIGKISQSDHILHPRPQQVKDKNSDNKDDENDLLTVTLDAMVNVETSSFSSSSSSDKNEEDLISQIRNVRLHCHITTHNEDRKDIERLQICIRNDPLPFLIHAVLHGSSVS